MPRLRGYPAGIILAMPAFLVPALEIPLVLWARHAFLATNPDYMDDPPTISLAISDPAIGDIFANVILVIAALVMLAMPMILWCYLSAIGCLPVSRGRRRVMQSLLAVFLIGQITASSGMVLTTQYTFSNGHDLHMLGSYIFFPAQALALLAAALLCRMLLHQQKSYGIGADAWSFRPGTHRFRFGFAFPMVFIAVCFGILFVIKDWNLPLPGYAVQVLFTQSEVLVIACYVVFFGSYSLDILHMVQRRVLYPPAGARAAAPPERQGARVDART